MRGGAIADSCEIQADRGTSTKPGLRRMAGARADSATPSEIRRMRQSDSRAGRESASAGTKTPFRAAASPHFAGLRYLSLGTVSAGNKTPIGRREILRPVKKAAQIGDHGGMPSLPKMRRVLRIG